MFCHCLLFFLFFLIHSIPPINKYIYVPVHTVHDTHVHNGTFITHSPYGLHAAIEPELAFVSPLLRPQSQRPGFPSACFSFPSLSDISSESEPQGP